MAVKGVEIKPVHQTDETHCTSRKGDLFRPKCSGSITHLKMQQIVSTANCILRFLSECHNDLTKNFSLFNLFFAEFLSPLITFDFIIYCVNCGAMLLFFPFFAVIVTLPVELWIHKLWYQCTGLNSTASSVVQKEGICTILLSPKLWI